MIAIFNNLPERRVTIGRWLTILIILLLCVSQTHILNEIYRNTRDDYADKVSSILKSQTEQLLLTKSLSVPAGYSAYNAQSHQIHIIKKSEGIDTTIRINPENDFNSIHNQAIYDIRDTSVWSLAQLGQQLGTAFKSQIFVSYYALTLTDQQGKVMDTYNSGNLAIAFPGLREEFHLGFLERHLLTLEFSYPLLYFWHEAWDRVTTTLILFLLLVLSSASLFVQLRNEKKSSECRKKFTHSLVHNLRSPLIHIKQQLETIEALGLSAEERQKALDKSRDKITNVLKNIEHLLSVSVNAYGLKVHQEWFDLNTIINTIATTYQQNRPEKKVSIILKHPLSQPVYADPTLLEGALGNLVGNSIKYSGPDTLICISCCKEKKKIVITVTDNGFGIPIKEQQYIFRENYQGRHYMTNREHKGFGLGLFYVQAVTLAHKGHISVKSDGKSGAEFIIEIPQKKKIS